MTDANDAKIRAMRQSSASKHGSDGVRGGCGSLVRGATSAQGAAGDLREWRRECVGHQEMNFFVAVVLSSGHQKIEEMTRCVANENVSDVCRFVTRKIILF